MKKLFFILLLSSSLYAQTWFSTTIDSLGTTSATIKMGYLRPVALVIDTLTGTHLTFLASYDEDSTFYPLCEQDSTLVTYPIRDSSYVALDISDFYGINLLKIVSDSTEADARIIRIRGEKISGDSR